MHSRKRHSELHAELFLPNPHAMTAMSPSSSTPAASPLRSWYERVSIAHVIFTLIIAACTAVVSARVTQTEQNDKIEQLKATQQKLVEEIVPRKEQESHWEAQENALREIRQDVRELRNEERRRLFR